MKNKSRIYLLDSQQYSPETIAVAFAKTSRSPEPFDQIAAGLNEEKSSEFNEKWVVGYGHSSVAEHAVLHIALENISRLAVENLESNRLASYTEKSTRYQTWDAGAFYTPAEIMDKEIKTEYRALCDELFAFYTRIIQRVSEVVACDCTRNDGESENAWKRRVQSTAIDSCRFVLPASSLANVGMTINARSLEHAISKMLSSHLEEVRRIGAEVKEVALEAVPTLVKYANANPYPAIVDQYCTQFNTPAGQPASDWCRLVDHAADLENRILAAVLYRSTNNDYAQSLAALAKMSPAQKLELTKMIFASRDRFTTPLRELEHSSFTFEIIADQGAWYEIKRHRMLTLTTQGFSPNLGFALPKVIDQAGFRDEYVSLMQKCSLLYTTLEKTQVGIGSYILPNAFKRRFLVTGNLRSLIHMINLRSATNAHYSVRRVALRMAELVQGVMPNFAPYIFNPSNEDWSMIEKRFLRKSNLR